jgi:hypothetical protein
MRRKSCGSAASRLRLVADYQLLSMAVVGSSPDGQLSVRPEADEAEFSLLCESCGSDRVGLSARAREAIREGFSLDAQLRSGPVADLLWRAVGERLRNLATSAWHDGGGRDALLAGGGEQHPLRPERDDRVSHMDLRDRRTGGGECRHTLRQRPGRGLPFQVHVADTTGKVYSVTTARGLIWTFQAGAGFIGSSPLAYQGRREVGRLSRSSHSCIVANLSAPPLLEHRELRRISRYAAASALANRIIMAKPPPAPPGPRAPGPMAHRTRQSGPSQSVVERTANAAAWPLSPGSVRDRRDALQVADRIRQKSRSVACSIGASGRAPGGAP